MCNNNDCKNDVYDAGSKCSLHNEKSDYQSDFHDGRILVTFRDELIEYIIDKLESSGNIEHDPDLLLNFLKSDIDIGRIAEYFLTKTIVLTRISFPCRDSRDTFDYQKVLRKIGKIHFNYCQFKGNGIELKKTQVFYQDCVFSIVNILLMQKY
ncbi:MAG: hypothetical protein HQ521_16035 [Bacteroidetes bacterium]|nr:hypothetical protein [Bacteroidota bacterium]